MIDVLDRRAARPISFGGRAIEALGGALLRYGLVLFLVGFGLYKFTDTEAQNIQPLLAHSPLFGWLYSVLSVQVVSDLVGLVEIGLGVLLVVRRRWPRASAIGGLGAAAEFVITLSFLFSTPGLSADTMGFLLKDLILLGAALWAAGDALDAAQAARP